MALFQFVKINIIEQFKHIYIVIQNVNVIMDAITKTARRYYT